jgi:hypothetical protein
MQELNGLMVSTVAGGQGCFCSVQVPPVQIWSYYGHVSFPGECARVSQGKPWRCPTRPDAPSRHTYSMSPKPEYKLPGEKELSGGSSDPAAAALSARVDGIVGLLTLSGQYALRQ